MLELPETRQSLFLRLRQRSDDGWAEFLTVYEQAIYRFCRARGLQDADACDVTQNVLAAVAKRVDSWDVDTSKGTFRGWLFRVARNIVVDSLVERGRQAAVTGDTKVGKALAELPDSEDAEASAFWLEYRRLLFHRVAEGVKREVRESTWRSFWMTAIGGQKPEQVANQLGISVGSVYTAKCRVVARIRARVAELDEGDPCAFELDEELDNSSIAPPGLDSEQK